MKHSTYQTLDHGSEEANLSSPKPAKKRCGMDSKSFILVTCILLMVFLFLLVIIIAATLHKPSEENLQGKLFTMDDLFDSNLQSKRVSINWWNDTTLLKKDSNGNIVFADLNNNPVALLVNASLVVDQGKVLSFGTYVVSPNAEYVLLAVQTTKLWRHSFLARYLVYDTVTQTVFDLTSPTDRLANVQWIPQGASKNLVAFVRANNIFLKEVKRGSTTEEYSVTTDGLTNEIVNGVFSWVYEEEVFGGYNAIWWAPSGAKLVFMKSNESQVPEFSFPVYNGGAYTDEIKIKYPKAGYPNPSVALWVFDLTTNNSFPLDTYSRDFEYIYSVQWNGETLYVQVVNRTQNRLQVLQYDSPTINPNPNPIFSQSSDTWVTVSSLYFYDNFIFTIQDNQGYNHIAKYSLDGSQTFVTSGNWIVTSILAFTDNQIYYISTEVSSIQRHLYRISLSGTDKVRLTNGEGWYSALFSPKGEYYVLEYSGPDVPNQKMLSTKDPNWNIVLETNSDLQQRLKAFNLPQKTFFEIPTADGNDKMNVFAMLPPNFDKDKKYPVLMQVYGGPNSQQVTTRFDQTGFNTYIASQLGYIVASVDGRGTGAKSTAFTKQVYLNLGHLETLDQLAGAEYFQSLSYVAHNKIAIWGWSYGGYMTGRALGFDSKNTRFKCGVSVAPVTSWIFYDSIYTERYMRTPQVNANGYDRSSVLSLAANISDHSLLLIHGTGDDNVHWQNSAELAKLLISLNKQFETMYYPNYDHSITARRHLYTLMSDYLTRKLS